MQGLIVLHPGNTTVTVEVVSISFSVGRERRVEERRVEERRCK